MSLSSHQIPTSHIEDYCRACWIEESQVPEYSKIVAWVIEWKQVPVLSFEELQNRLASMERFPNNWKFNVQLQMNYQDYVGLHQERMYQFVFLFKDELEEIWIDIEVLLFLCRFHDAPEWVSIFWDILTIVKDTFTTEVQNIHILYERAIVKILSEHILTWDHWIHTENIHPALEWTIEKKELITQLLSYFDKFDALMISLHEVLSWNSEHFMEKLQWYLDFMKEVFNGNYLPLVNEFIDTIPAWSPLQVIFSQEYMLQIQESIQTNQSGNLFSESDVENDFWVPVYWHWKKTVTHIKSIQVGERYISGYESLFHN